MADPDKTSGGKSLMLWLAAGGVVAAVAAGYAVFTGATTPPPTGPTPQVVQVALIAEKDIPDFAPGYITAPIVSVADAKSMVGMIFGRTKGVEVWDRRDIRFIPKEMKFIIDDVSPNETPLFHGYVSAKASIGGKLTAGAATWDAEDVAEVTLKNLHAFVYDAAQIPMAELQNVLVEPNREALFVRQVNVTEFSARRFQKRAGTAEANALQVQINGSVYVHRTDETRQHIVSFQPIEMPAPKSVGADAPPDVKKAAEDVKVGTASPIQKTALADYFAKRAETTLIREKGITAITRFKTGPVGPTVPPHQ